MREGIYIAAFIFLLIGIAYTIRSTTDIGKKSDQKEQTDKKDKKDKKSKDKDDSEDKGNSGLTVVKKYEVPEILKEISAVAYLDKDRFACIQDELGEVFIYNATENKIEKEIPFAPKGDYEGLAVVQKTLFVLRADGQIYEVKNFESDKPIIRVHKTHLTAKHDTEALCYDKNNNRLLVAIKGSETENPDYKGIYGFDLKTFKMDKSPVFKIDLNHRVFEDLGVKKPGSQIQPSAISIHPITGDLYVIEATNPKLLIMDSAGKIKSLKSLNKKEFEQPEGISFSPEGKLFISNEGKSQGNILELSEL